VLKINALAIVLFSPGREVMPIHNILGTFPKGKENSQILQVYHLVSTARNFN
jgi:hypothetical protein